MKQVLAVGSRVRGIRFERGDLEQKDTLQLQQGVVIRADVRAQFHAPNGFAENRSERFGRVSGHSTTYDAARYLVGCSPWRCFQVKSLSQKC